MFNLVYSNTNVILVQVVASPFLTSKVRLERALQGCDVTYNYFILSQLFLLSNYNYF
jgi:hypothetical protein